MYSDIVLKSTYFSVIIQAITGLIGASGLLIPLAAEHQILKSVLLKETIVQIIEFCVYLIIISRYQLETMAATRYLDWFFTTPVMLFTTIIYFKYCELQENKEDTSKMSVKNFINENSKNIILILVSNLGMLVAGYLGELEILDRYTACFIGFLFFVLTFTIIYREYARYSKIGKLLYSFLVTIWALYSVAYLLRADFKNITINGLDIVAKNFFGVFLFAVILTINKKEKEKK